MKETTIKRFWENFRIMEDTDLVQAKLTEYIKYNNKKDTKHWYLINIFEYDVHDIIKVLNKMRYPYIHQFGNVWLGISSIYIKDICKNKTIIALAKNVREIQQVSDSDTTDTDTDSDTDESDTDSSYDSDTQ